MKIQILAACLMGSALITTSLVHSAPNGNGMQPTKFKSHYDSVSAGSYDGKVSQNVSGAVYDDLSGAVMINLWASSYNEETQESWSIFCNYQAGEAEVSINKVNGYWELSLQGTLDPTDSRCSSYNVADSIVINLTGSTNANGDYQDSSTGHGKATYLGTSWTYNYKNDQFSADLTGSANSMSGPWYGYGATGRNTNLQKIK